MVLKTGFSFLNIENSILKVLLEMIYKLWYVSQKWRGTLSIRDFDSFN